MLLTTQFVDAVRNEDYVSVAQHLMNGYTIKYSDLHAAASLKECGMIRVLLDNSTLKCGGLLSQHVSTATYKVVLAILESKNTTIDQDTVMSAVMASREDVVTLLLTDPRTYISKPENILQEAAKLGSANILKLVCFDKRFDCEPQYYCMLLTALECESEECTQYLLDFYTPGDDTEKDAMVLHKALAHNNTANVQRVIIKLDIYLSSMGAVKRVASMSNTGMFRVVCTTANMKFLEALLLHCIQVNAIAKIKILLEVNRITLTVKNICDCVSNYSSYIMELVTTHKFHVCNVSHCAILTAVTHKMDYRTFELLKHNKKVGIRCTHLKEVFHKSVDNRCTETIHHFLEYMDTVECSLIPKIVAMNNPRLSTLLASRIAVFNPAYLVPALENYHLDSVMSICMTTSVDLSWGNYTLIRIAAKDKTEESLRSLFARLP